MRWDIVIVIICLVIGLIIFPIWLNYKQEERLNNMLSEHGYQEDTDGWYSQEYGMICHRIDGVTDNRSVQILQHEICHSLVAKDKEHFCTKSIGKLNPSGDD